MTNSVGRSHLKKQDFRERAAANRWRSAVWILVALGSLTVGLIGGTVMGTWKRELAWVIPAAAFAAYLLAFRQGMLLWNPAVDRTWRRRLRLDEEVITEEEAIPRVSREDPELALKLLRRRTPGP